MSSVLLSAIAGMGAAQHLVSVAEALRARGHRVSVVSAEVAREYYRHLDVEFHPVAERPVPELLPRLPPVLRRARQVYDRVQQLVIDPLPDQWTVVRRVLEEASVDVVVTDALFLGGSALSFLPADARPPVVVLGCFAPWAPDPAVPPYGMGAAPGEAGGGRRVRTAAYELMARPAYAALSRAFQHQVERTFGVRPDHDFRVPPRSMEAWVQLGVPRFEYPRTALPPRFRFIGPLHPPVEAAIPEWWDPMREPPVVVVRADGRAGVEDLVRPTVSAFAGAEDTVLVTGVPRAAVTEQLGALPRNVHFEERIPWPRLVPRRTVVVTDGDYLHTLHALRFGVPLVVAGTLETDVETAARVAWSGAGIDLRRQGADAATIRAAVAEIRADDSYRLAAARIAAQIAETDAESQICDLVEQHARARA